MLASLCPWGSVLPFKCLSFIIAGQSPQTCFLATGFTPETPAMGSPALRTPQAPVKKSKFLRRRPSDRFVSPSQGVSSRLCLIFFARLQCLRRYCSDLAFWWLAVRLSKGRYLRLCLGVSLRLTNITAKCLCLYVYGVKHMFCASV
jgi:hypothetical protein